MTEKDDNKDRKLAALLCEYFRNKPDGEYHPFFVRKDMGIPQTTWRNLMKHRVYPQGSKAREMLARSGVTIVNKGSTEASTGGTIIKSVFVKDANAAAAT